MQLTAERRFSSGLGTVFAYTLSRTLDNVSDITAAVNFGNTFQNVHCFDCDWSVSPQASPTSSAGRRATICRSGQGTSLAIRLEAFNALNFVQFGGPVTRIANAAFGKIFLTQVNTPRQVQLGARLSF
jgi:hypothetical protein